MAKKNFRNWVGYKEEAETIPSDNAVERIRQLEAQITDLRARRDLTALSKEEFEILATETAMSLIKTAQTRESRANASAERTINDAARSVKEKIDAAESKAKAILSGAESRGRKYIQAAEGEAEEIKVKVVGEVEALVNESKRQASALSAAAKREADALSSAAQSEAVALASAAKREAQNIISSATSEISNFRIWLTSAISESERLYRIQTQSLTAAEHAIVETRGRLATAFERLANLQTTIDENLDANDHPRRRSFSKSDDSPVKGSAAQKKAVAKKVPKKSAKKSPAKKRK